MTAIQVNPEPLGRGRNLILEVLTSLLLFLLTIPLFFFAVVVARLDGSEVDEWMWEVVLQISRILASALPIWFALVVGRAIRQFAGWRLERGVTLRSLEQLMGSLTVGGTLVTAFSLRTFNAALLFLVLGWSLSPLGGQSSLQMIYVVEEPVVRFQELRYIDTAVSPPLEYSSLLGIPMTATGLTDNSESADFTIESAYFALSCPIFQTVDKETFESTKCEPMDFSPAGSNTTLWAIGQEPLQFAFSEHWDFYTDVYAGNYSFLGNVHGFGNESNDFIVPAGRLYFHSYPYQPAWERNSSRLWYAHACCELTTEYVETAITCHGGKASSSCSANAIRPSLIPHAPRNLTNLGFTVPNMYTRLYMTTPNDRFKHVSQSPVTEIFLAEPNNVSAALPIRADYSAVSREQFEIRFQQLLNTYWYASFSPPTFAGGLGNDPTPESNLTTIATVTSHRQVYRVRWPWLAVFILSISVMAASCFAAAVFGGMTIGPQVLGYCSTLLAAYPLVKQGYGEGTWMGGAERAERARAFGDTQVRLVDLAANRDIGFVAVAGEQIDDEGVAYGALERSDRAYQ